MGDVGGWGPSRHAAELMAMLEEEGGTIVILGEPDRLEVAMGGKSFSSRPVCFVWRTI
jgi:hypothetical protein